VCIEHVQGKVKTGLCLALLGTSVNLPANLPLLSKTCVHMMAIKASSSSGLCTRHAARPPWSPISPLILRSPISSTIPRPTRPLPSTHTPPPPASPDSQASSTVNPPPVAPGRSPAPNRSCVPRRRPARAPQSNPLLRPFFSTFGACTSRRPCSARLRANTVL
jgi:hypothetical protein